MVQKKRKQATESPMEIVATKPGQIDTPEIDPERGSLFISHAVEDRDFTVWLGARLSAAGYDVWTDISRLKGGDDWERKLAHAIRHKTRKMLLVATAKGVEKRGVLNEIHIAKEVESKIGDEAFVIPLRLENFSSPYLTVHHQWIDFKPGWGEGLAELLETLATIPGLHRTQGLNAESMRRWLEAEHSQKVALSETPEVLLSSWLRLVQMPATLRYFLFSGAGADQLANSAVASARAPAVQHGSGFIGFGDLADYVQEDTGTFPKLVQEIPTDDFLRQGDRGLRIERNVASNILTSLLRDAFERFLKGKGLSTYEYSDRSRGYWVANGLIKGKERVAFDFQNGWKGGRNLTGDVKKGEGRLYWHFGVTPRIRVRSDGSHAQMTLRVIFTEDGTKPLGNAKAMHRYRRSVVKSWRNDRWRDMLLAFLFWTADGQNTFDVPVGGGRVLKFSTMPVTMQAPVSISSASDTAADGVLEEGDPVFNVGHGEEDDDDSDV